MAGTSVQKFDFDKAKKFENTLSKEIDAIVKTLNGIKEEVDGVRSWWKGGSEEAFIQNFERIKADLEKGLQQWLEEYQKLIEIVGWKKIEQGVSLLDMLNMPAANKKNVALQKSLQNIWHKKAGGSYEKLESLCQIKQNTFQTWMNGRRNISRSELAKFVIGLTLDRKTADELFALQGHPLDEKDIFDFIIICAIRDNDDIAQFGKDVLIFCNQRLF